MSATDEQLRIELRDLEYAEGYAESFLNAYVATQIKVLREQRQMKQSDLAHEMGTTQTAISRVENVNYSAWNINTLRKIARALKVRLRISFETFGSLPQDMDGFGREALQRPAHDEDPQLWSERPILEAQSATKFEKAGLFAKARLSITSPRSSV